MADNCNFVSILGVLLILTMFDNPIIVYAGEGVPNVALFTFGDSYYDVGNKVLLSKDKNPAQTKWPYGKSRDDPNGKFSDGHIVPDFIADFMSIPNGVPPALKPDANVTRGVSYAVTDASILGSPAESMTLSQQVTTFESMKSNWTTGYIKKSLFMIYIGTEDYLNYIQKHPDADATKQQAFVTSVTSQLKTDIRSLTNLGARKFVVQLLAPLGCLPIVRQDYKTGNDCYELLNDLAKQHNEKIGPMLNDFANSPDIDGFQFAVFDFYDAILRRTQRNLNYRFYVSNSSCCGVGTHNAYDCGKGNVHSKLCDYQRAYLFFDGRHNSEKAQEEIAHLLYSANLNVIQPMNIRELIVYPTGEKMREFWEPNTFSARRRLPSQDSYAGYSA
ncbi:PREDICTED: GDSL esterase/lipase ESM1-like [Camelina sativa]|uniref:GDSL esterase/lipase ESM1-like n=1 Tax=Camelina sativa TaxID=90675 RepID=A0ABM0XKA7_CAMSA|nr:PREDICTED: GDSL esterase/lipase ESM1-like [Camelina sativa]